MSSQMRRFSVDFVTARNMAHMLLLAGWSTIGSVPESSYGKVKNCFLNAFRYFLLVPRSVAIFTVGAGARDPSQPGFNGRVLVSGGVDRRSGDSCNGRGGRDDLSLGNLGGGGLCDHVPFVGVVRVLLQCLLGCNGLNRCKRSRRDHLKLIKSLGKPKMTLK